MQNCNMHKEKSRTKCNYTSYNYGSGRSSNYYFVFFHCVAPTHYAYILSIETMSQSGIFFPSARRSTEAYSSIFFTRPRTVS